MNEDIKGTVQIVEGDSPTLRPGWKWAPTSGRELADLLDVGAPPSARQSVADSAVAILAKSAPVAGAPTQETGLVVGYVQSGKTLSFTAVTALAHDNIFPIVIVIAGTSIPLFNQSSRRLRRDLRLESRSDRKWQLFENPPMSDSDRRAMQDVLDDWHDSDTPRGDKQTVLIAVMKQYQHLDNLIRLIEELQLGDVPVLVVDDEADQASQNTQAAQGQQSTTYRKISELRGHLPRHTYLQYTATPQAPLLINIIDALSPNFIEVLQPGEAYVGGGEFFDRDDLRLTKTIPTNEVPSPTNSLTEPPSTLLEALRMFLIGVAAGLLDGGVGNRSMLVHPSRTTDFHFDYVTWVGQIFESWKDILRLPEDASDRQQLLDDFRGAYDELLGTVERLPSFEEIVQGLRRAFRRTRILEVNAARGETPKIDWSSSYGWILVGGQAMDRGFTVEGLTVTYMPRGIGVGNADTLQQRARFFGYKRSYIGYCRVYLENGTRQAFIDYVEHEEDIRAQLIEYQRSGRPLKEWKRAFVMAPTLRPTRASVQDLDYMRGNYSDAWYFPRLILAPDPILDSNRRVVDQFVGGLRFVPDEGHSDRTLVMRHEVSREVPLQSVVEELLLPLRIFGSTDSQKYIGLLLQLRKALEDREHPPRFCSIYKISPGAQRERGLSDNGEIKNPFQGESPVHPVSARGSVYPGDTMIRAHSEVSVQIHRLNLTQGDDNRVVARDVPFVAIWVPNTLGRNWISQERANYQA